MPVRALCSCTSVRELPGTYNIAEIVSEPKGAYTVWDYSVLFSKYLK